MLKKIWVIPALLISLNASAFDGCASPVDWLPVGGTSTLSCMSCSYSASNKTVTITINGMAYDCTMSGLPINAQTFSGESCQACYNMMTGQ